MITGNTTDSATSFLHLLIVELIKTLVTLPSPTKTFRKSQEKHYFSGWLPLMKGLKSHVIASFRCLLSDMVGGLRDSALTSLSHIRTQSPSLCPFTRATIIVLPLQPLGLSTKNGPMWLGFSLILKSQSRFGNKWQISGAEKDAWEEER